MITKEKINTYLELKKEIDSFGEQIFDIIKLNYSKLLESKDTTYFGCHLSEKGETLCIHYEDFLDLYEIIIPLKTPINTLEDIHALCKNLLQKQESYLKNISN